MGKLCFQKEGPRGDLEEGSRQEVTQTKPIRHLENLTVRDEIDKLWLARRFFFMKERILDRLGELCLKYK